MNRPLAGRHAGYDDNGTPRADFDVLDAEELAEDYGWIPRRRSVPVPPDPETFAELVRLQRAVAS